MSAPAPGSRSRSTCPTAGRRSRASCGSPGAWTRGRDSVPPVELATGSAQAVPPVRPAAHLRRQHDGGARERRTGRSPRPPSRSRSTVRPSSWSASWRRTPAGSSASWTCSVAERRPAHDRPPDPADLPERLQAWSALGQIVWQDEDAASLTPGAMEALRGWIAGGGRLVITGGTSGADALNAFPTTCSRSARPRSWTSILRRSAGAGQASRRGAHDADRAVRRADPGPRARRLRTTA